MDFPPAALSGHVNGNNRWAKIKVTKEWRAKAAEAAKKAESWIDRRCFDEAKAYTPEGDIHLHVSFTPPTKQGDRVNFPNRMKPVFDGIADALGVNDSRFVPHYTFRAPEKPGHIEIWIEQ